MKNSPSAKYWLLLVVALVSALLHLGHLTPVYAQDERPVFTVDECLATKGGYTEDNIKHIAWPGGINCSYKIMSADNEEFLKGKDLYVIYHPSPAEALADLKERFLNDEHLKQFSCETYNDCDRVDRVLLERTENSFYGYSISISQYTDVRPDYYSLERRYVTGNYNVTIFVSGRQFSDIEEAMSELEELETMAKVMVSQPREMVIPDWGNDNSNSNENSNFNENSNSNENSNDNTSLSSDEVDESAPAEELTEVASETTVEDQTEATVQTESEPQAANLSELYQELEAFLAGEGITAPSPGQIAAGGVTLATLLGGWLLLNLFSGTPAEASLAAISAWQNQKPPQAPTATAEPELPEKTDEEPEPTQPEKTPPPQPVIPLTAELPPDQPPPRTPASGETTEESIVRNIRDIKDLDDAVKQTRQDFEAFIDQVPASVRNSHEWQTLIDPKLDRIQELIKNGELDQTRTWLERVEALIELRNDVERDLGYLPSDSQEAIVWTERTLQTLGHFASDAYQNLVIEPAKNAGGAILPSELSDKWGEHMDELGQALSDVAQQVSELPRQGTRLLTHGNLQDQASEMMQSSSPIIQQEGQEIRNLVERDSVEYPDFWGKGTKKVSELWNNSLGKIFD